MAKYTNIGQIMPSFASLTQIHLIIWETRKTKLLEPLTLPQLVFLASFSLEEALSNELLMAWLVLDLQRLFAILHLPKTMLKLAVPWQRQSWFSFTANMEVCVSMFHWNFQFLLLSLFLIIQIILLGVNYEDIKKLNLNPFESKSNSNPPK